VRFNIGSNCALARHFVFLAPSRAVDPGFGDIRVDRTYHDALLGSAQRLRAAAYIENGAVGPEQLTCDGRFVQEFDRDAWHLVTVEADGRVSACARYALHENTVRFTELGVSRSALAQSEVWGHKLRAAVEEELHTARRRSFRYAEVGGWAIETALRCTTEAVRMMLAFYALSEWFGGVLGIGTAKRLCSAPVLKRIGGWPMSYAGCDLPAYYEPQYRDELEVIRFDSSRPNTKYRSSLDSLQSTLPTIPVVARSALRPLAPPCEANRSAPQLLLAFQAETAC